MTLKDELDKLERTIASKIDRHKYLNIQKQKLLIGVKDEFQKKAVEDYIRHERSKLLDELKDLDQMRKWLSELNFYRTRKGDEQNEID